MNGKREQIKELFSMWKAVKQRLQQPECVKASSYLFLCFFQCLYVSASLAVSPSLDGCLCVVAVDLEACREPSKGAVALHDHEAVGGGP